jgi:hypothetical protein
MPYFDTPIPIKLYLENNEKNPAMKLFIENSRPIFQPGASIVHPKLELLSFFD